MGKNTLSTNPKHEKLRKIVYKRTRRSLKRSHRFVSKGVINLYPDAHPDKIHMVKIPGQFGYAIMLSREFEKKLEQMLGNNFQVQKRSDFYTFHFDREADEVMFRMTFL
jgi:hypothetical protein